MSDKKKVVNNISVDCVIFGFDTKTLNILLVERELKKKETNETVFLDHTLLGFHIYTDELLIDAAKRITKELTGLDNIFLEQIITLGNPNRLSNPKDQEWMKHVPFEIDPRTLTVVYNALIDSTKVDIKETDRKAKWFPIHELPEMGFDHREIVDIALEKLRTKVLLEPIVFELLPEKFTLTQLQKVYEVVLDIKLDRRNFRKKISQMKYIIPLNEKQIGVAHKPAQLFFYSKEVFERTKRDKYLINF